MATAVARRAPGSASVDSRRIRQFAEKMLEELGRERAELSVLLTNDAFIRSLNRNHRGKDSATDVLAFPMSDAAGPSVPDGGGLLGDVVISIDTALRQARKRRRPLHHEVAFLLAHGVLHLIGYDHRNDREEREMDRMTRRLFKAAVGTDWAEKTLSSPLRSGS